MNTFIDNWTDVSILKSRCPPEATAIQIDHIPDDSNYRDISE